ncbi:MAG: haloacid dehalogenase type II [Pseudomonadota bacterium]
MNKPKAFLFDVFGTVVDWRSGVANACRTMFNAKAIEFDPLEFADLWREQYQPSMEKIRSGNRGYVVLDQLHLENLDRVLEQTGLSAKFDEQERQELNHGWERLPAWPDCSQGLTELKKKAIIAPCSNGSIAMMTRIAKYSNLPWDCILGAEIAGNYKPHPDAYLKSVAALGLEPHEVMMVAAHNSDLAAARECGLITAFIPRTSEYGKSQKTDLEPSSNWNFVVNSIAELA